MNTKNKTIAIIGLGYVGLPLAVEFGKYRNTVGYDINPNRIKKLQLGHDHTLECSEKELQSSIHLRYSDNVSDIKTAQIFIITVPTPVDQANRPDMTALVKASETVGAVLKMGDIVVYESTVYPGATEEVCVPVLEKFSRLKYNKEFYCGYSPERINPGDKDRRLTAIKKITSGSTPKVADEVDELYSQIIIAGTHKVSSIKVAEAAKVIENTQRDLNIALVNEFSLIFNRMNINTLEVLEAAGTKWNFLPFRPGLVGGHCISVDPYYLTHKAQELGYHPEVILAGRRVNDYMAVHVASETIKLMLRKGIQVLNSQILVLGLSFKENCPDVRNTNVIGIVKILTEYNVNVDVYDPWIDPIEVEHEYGLRCLPGSPNNGKYDAIIIAVSHKQFVRLGEKGIKSWGKQSSVVFDVKSILPLGRADGSL